MCPLCLALDEFVNSLDFTRSTTFRSMGIMENETWSGESRNVSLHTSHFIHFQVKMQGALCYSLNSSQEGHFHTFSNFCNCKESFKMLHLNFLQSTSGWSREQARGAELSMGD